MPNAAVRNQSRHTRLTDTSSKGRIQELQPPLDTSAHIKPKRRNPQLYSHRPTLVREQSFADAFELFVDAFERLAFGLQALAVALATISVTPAL